MANETWDWVWNPERKKWMIEDVKGKRYEIVWNRNLKKQPQAFPFKVLCNGETALHAENNGFAKSMQEAKRIAREAAEGRPRTGMDNPEFMRRVRAHRRRLNKPLY